LFSDQQKGEETIECFWEASGSCMTPQVNIPDIRPRSSRCQERSVLKDRKYGKSRGYAQQKTFMNFCQALGLTSSWLGLGGPWAEVVVGCGPLGIALPLD